jgi:hypothetical protein
MRETNVIFGGRMSITLKTEDKKLEQEISLAQHIEAGRRMKWSDTDTSFGPEDHPNTSLNKACLKDEYPLPCICQIIDSTASCELLSFLDAYSGYHQISLAIDDEEKTAFILPFRIFCYTKMAFGLKNGGATNQKCVRIILEPQIGRNIKAYIDDIVVKSKKKGSLLDNRDL